jgi:predicted ATPase
VSAHHNLPAQLTSFVGRGREVAPTVAAALGMQSQADRPVINQLVDALRARRLLLILDNCEHLVDACARLADTRLRGCPDVQILATSREPLRVAGETSWRVPSLDVPPGGEVPPIPDLEGFEAVRLFLARAKAASPDFSLTGRNAAAVAQGGSRSSQPVGGRVCGPGLPCRAAGRLHRCATRCRGR